MKFEDILREIDYNPRDYLNEVRKRAKNNNYNPADVEFSDKMKNKLMISDPDGKKVHFGLSGYGDFLIYKHLEREGIAPTGTAEKKRNVFQRSHGQLQKNIQARNKGRDLKYTPNQLALLLNW
jgi:hypothetical protein